MKNFTGNRGRRIALITRRAAALLSIASLFSCTLALGVETVRTTPERLNNDQRILHVLNRLGFGARPGDVERIRAMGLDNYLTQQLHPETIADPVADAKTSALPTLSMPTAQLYARYPQPGQVIRQLQRRGELPAGLAAVQNNKAGGVFAPPPAAAGQPNGAATEANPQAGAAPQAGNGADADGKQEYRKTVRDYYLQNNLQPPARIIEELQASRILRAVYSDRQLQESMVDFWENHFNIFAGKGADRWLLTSFDRDTIRPHTLGKFYDLLRATAESPAMLFYLDNFQSVSPNAQMMNRPGARSPLFELMRGRMAVGRTIPGAGGGQQRPGGPAAQTAAKQQPKRGINENYARELMELHTLGVDGGYTQKDVQEVARCFTGWTIIQPRGAGGANPDAGTFFFNARLHDNGEKEVLGHKILAGGGMNDGLTVLDILAHHPSTAKFIATKLTRHFVMDNPSPELVSRVAAAYLKSDGDLRETMRAIITSPEFNSPAAYRAKIKTPFELAVSSIRALGGDTDGRRPIHQWIARMGQPVYGYQTPNGYADVAEAWVNTGSLLERLNFGLALASNRIPGTHVDLARFAGEAAANGPSIDRARVIERFADVILQGDVSPNTRATLLKQLDQPLQSPDAKTEMDGVAGAGINGRVARREIARNDLPAANPEVVKIAGLILGSPEFQRQ